MKEADIRIVTPSHLCKRIPRGCEPGTRYGKLTVVAFLGCGNRSIAYASFKCDCGSMHTGLLASVRNGSTSSCGCFNREMAAKRQFKHGHAVHGTQRTSEYTTWQHMIKRCTNPNTKGYSNYGGRGIKVCERWLHSFENFLADMGPKPSPAHSIDRYPDNNGNYEPKNCRWATRTEQSFNKRTNRLIQHNGETLPLSVWAGRTGMKRETIADRLAHGWTISDTLTIPVQLG